MRGSLREVVRSPVQRGVKPSRVAAAGLGLPLFPLFCLFSLFVVPACASRPPAPPAPLVAANGPSLPAPARVRVPGAGPSSPRPDAIAHLLDAPWAARVDRRRTVSLPLPDGAAWTHVKYWGVTTLAGYRYGNDHHVALAVFTYAPPPGGATVDACAQRLASWGEARAKKYDIDVGEPRVERIAWPPGSGDHAKVFVLDARRRSILGTKRYAAAYAVYPAWREACLAVGFAVPEGGATEDARALRDRLVRDALPGLTVKADAGALALEARSDVED